MIDVGLPVRRPRPDTTLPDLGYWPSYARIAPECRSAYLEWLAGGRSDPSIDIGYVFLFFYGLERRLLVDAKTSEHAKAEAQLIISEAKRLLDLYGKNPSFHGYASGFVEVCQYLYTPEAIETRPRQVVWRGEYPLSLKVTLSDLALNGRPIPPDSALSWLEHSVEFSLRTPARRCRSEFENLFNMRYKTEFDDGMVIKPNKTPLRFSYRPASSAFQSAVVLEAKDAPDITALKWPLKKLAQIAQDCTDELDAYSRYLGRTERQLTLSALGLLPAELVLSSQDSRLIQLNDWLQRAMTNQVQVMNAVELLEFFSLDSQQKISKAEFTGVAQLLAKLGYGIEPDPRFSVDAITPASQCVLFRITEGHVPSMPTEAYTTATLILRLAAAVISADGSISPQEEELLERHVESVLDLSPSERQRLKAYLRWLTLTPPDMAGLKKRLSTWSVRDRQSAVRLLLLVANADNKIDPAEVKILTRIYKLLELDPETLFSDLHAVQTRPDELPATILHPDVEPSGRHIPRPADIARPQPAGVALDVEAIERTLRETHEVQQLLASVFAEEDVAPTKPPPVQTVTESILGLDSTHSSLLARLLTKPEWKRPDLEAICTEYQVLPDGAIETINTAAIEQHGDLLFDLSDSLQINEEIAKEVYA